MRLIYLHFRCKFQSWCKHIHVTMVRCFLNYFFLTTVMLCVFVIERKVPSTYVPIHLNIAISSMVMFANSILLVMIFELLFTPNRRIKSLPWVFLYIFKPIKPTWMLIFLLSWTFYVVTMFSTLSVINRYVNDPVLKWQTTDCQHVHCITRR